MDDEYREDAGDTAYKNVISFLHARRVEADLRAYVSRFNTAREAAFASCTLGKPMSGEIVSAHLLHTSALSSSDGKFALGSVGGNLSDLGNIQQNLRRIVVSSHPTNSGETMGKHTAHNSFLASEGEGESSSSEEEESIQMAYASYLAKKKKFDIKYKKNNRAPTHNHSPPVVRSVAEIRLTALVAHA